MSLSKKPFIRILKLFYNNEYVLNMEKSPLLISKIE